MANDWKEWTGGNLPKRNYETRVQVIWRNGSESKEYTAEQLRWQWGDNPDDWDVTFYRKIAE